MTTDPVVYSNAVKYLDQASNSGFYYRPTSGQFGAAGVEQVAEGTIVVTTGDEGLPYRMVRVPTTAIIKKVEILLDATVTTFTGDIGFYFSDSTTDGTPATLQGLEGSRTFFAYEEVMGSYSPVQSGAAGHRSDPTDGTNVGLNASFVDLTFQNAANQTSGTVGFYVPSASMFPLWMAAAFGGNGNGITPNQPPVAATTGTGAASTGNMAGLLTDPGGFFDITITNTSANSGAAVVTLRVTFVIPGA